MTWVAAGAGCAVSIPDGAPAENAPPDRVIRVGDAAQALPAPVLPPSGRALPALTQARPADVISGWVRLWVAGFLAGHPRWDGVICAQHADVTHWLHVSAAEVVSSRSFLSLRLISALGGADHAAPEAIADSMSHPDRLAGQLRVAEVTGAAAAITGHLIGAELAAARSYWLGQQVAVIGEAPIMTLYADAIAAQGCPVVTARIPEVLPKGLGALAQVLGLDD